VSPLSPLLLLNLSTSQPLNGGNLTSALFIRLPNWVGDVCMALPAIDRLARAGFALRLGGRAWASDLLAGHGHAVAALPRGLRASAAATRCSGARHGVLFTNSLGSALAARLGGVAAVGHRGEGRSCLLAVAVRRVAVHEVEAFWHLAGEAVKRWAGGDGDPPPPSRLALVLSAAHRDAATTALAAAGIAAPYRVLCPSATGTIAGIAKCWPGFAMLCRGLVERGERVVACPGPGEEAAVTAALPGATILSGLGLGAYAAVLAGARGVIANDSGPLHLAAAVGAAVIGVFGPSDPARTRPWSPAGRCVVGADGWPQVDAVRGVVDEMG